MHDVGSAVMTFLGDTTNLDEAVSRAADNVNEAMGRAADGVDVLADALGTIEPVLANSRHDVDAWNETIMDALHGATGGVKEFGVEASGSMHEARGAMKLVEETLGIHIPREMNTLIAGIPGLTAAFSMMLPIVGVIAAVDVIGKLIDKHDALKRAQEKVALEAENLAIKEGDQTKSMELANLKIDDQIAKLEGRPEQNRLKEALIETGMAADTLAARFSEMFQKTNEALEETTGFFGRLKMDMYSWAALMSAWPGQIGEAFHRVTSGTKDVASAMKGVNDQLRAVNKLRADSMAGKPEAEQIQRANELAAAYKKLGEVTQSALKVVETQAPQDEKAITALSNQVVAASAAQADAVQTVANVQKRVREEGLAGAVAAATVQEKLAKQGLDAQIASIEAWKAAQHTVYALGQTDAAAWAVAELHATDAAAIAHEDYLKKIIAIYTKAGEVEKARAATQELATLQTKNEAEATEKAAQAMQQHTQYVRKVRDEYLQLIATNIDKEWEKTQKAVEGLTRAEEDLAKAQAKLDETKLSDKYRDEESAIKKLAEMHLITEEQMNDRLAVLEQQQAAEAGAILDKQLAKQQADVAAAQAKLADETKSPFVTQAQILETEANLKKLQAAVVATETEIVATKEKFNKQSEADDKGHYGRALQLAMAAGNELLAEQLKQNHALLIAAQAELTTAKARGLNTTAIEKEISALKQNEQALEKESNGGKLATTEKQKFIQTALLAAQAELTEAKARGLNSTAIEKEIKDLTQLLKLLQQQPAQMKQVSTGLQGLRLGYQELGTMVKNVEQQMSQAYATAIMGALESGKSIGAALEAATKQVLLQLATQALAKALFYTAEGIANSLFDPPAAATYFAAAAEFALVAGVAGGVGLAMPGAGSGSGSGSGGAPQAGQTQASGSGGGGSQQTVGVTHLAAGGVVSRRIMIGDSPSGGDADEAILPLSDPSAMSKIVNAIMPVLPQNAPGFGFATPAQRPPLGFDLSQPSSSERPDLHSGNPNDGDFERSESSMPRDMEGMQALAASFGGLLSTPTLRAGASARTASASAAAAVPPPGFDSNSMEKFADRIGQHMAANGSGSSSSGGGDTHIHNNIKGLMDSGNLKKIMKKQNRMIQNRQATLKASDSLRLTRRSN